jgi:MFS superfamily sulfate permease-like transporter
MASESKPGSALGDHLRNLRYDLPAGLVVFLVALPLCLGIALASGAPPLAGIVTGIVGGMLVAWVSGSHTAVTGPAAGLIVVVLAGIESLGYRGFLLATSIAGVMQIGFGLARLGGISRLFPSSVIKGMLVAIGVIVLLQQLPKALGWPGSVDYGDLASLLGQVHPGAVILTAVGLGMIVLAGRVEWLKRIRWLPGPLLAVLAGVALNELFRAFAPGLALGGEALVQIPTDDPLGALATPDFSMIGDARVWLTAVTIALIASIESLVCAEALDSMDPFERKTPTNRELFAQGTGNLVVGLLGGIPMTSLIVRGSTNVQAGSRTRVSSFTHGALLLATILVLTPVLNHVPLAALAAVLLHVGFKLAHPSTIRALFARSPSHWVPFVATVALVVATDLLTGVVAGFAVAVLFIGYEALRVRRAAPAPGTIEVRIGPSVPWLSKLAFRGSLGRVPEGAVVQIDASDADPVHDDLRAEIARFVERARKRRVEVRVRDLPGVSAAEL